jgi:hypothetical protein
MTEGDNLVYHMAEGDNLVYHMSELTKLLTFHLRTAIRNGNLLLDVDIYHKILTYNVCKFNKLSHNKRDYLLYNFVQSSTFSFELGARGNSRDSTATYAPKLNNY